MYEFLMHILRAFIGYGALRYTMSAAIIFVVIGMILRSSSTFKNKKSDTGKRRVLAEIGNGLFKLCFIALFTRLLIVTLSFQAAAFKRAHGRISEKNRSAIIMKWGMPHEQSEIRVTQRRKRIWVIRQLLLKGESKQKDKVYSESFWKDQKPPLKPVNEKLPIVLTEKETDKWVVVPQKSILSSKVDIKITNNPRKLGNANYAGYSDEWELSYVITNTSKWITAVNVWFELPAETGLFDKMSVTLDGVDVLQKVKNTDYGFSIPFALDKNGKKTLKISYTSRGLEYLRYIPARMTQTPSSKITMHLNGIPAEKIDYPIGSMPPLEKLDNLKGEQKYTLNWSLNNALTSYDIGIKLPKAMQPEYHYSKLLSEAPVGLVILLVAVIGGALILGTTLKLDIVAVIAIAYCLHYSFMGHLADLMSGFWGPYIISSSTLLILIVIFRLLLSETPKCIRVIDIASFAVMIIFFPLAVIDSERTSFWMQLFYIALILYIAILIIISRKDGLNLNNGNKKIYSHK